MLTAKEDTQISVEETILIPDLREITRAVMVNRAQSTTSRRDSSRKTERGKVQEVDRGRKEERDSTGREKTEI